MSSTSLGSLPQFSTNVFSFLTSTSGTPLASRTTNKSSSTYVMYRSREYRIFSGSSKGRSIRVADMYVSLRRIPVWTARSAFTEMVCSMRPPKSLTGTLASTRGASREMAISKSPTSATLSGTILPNVRANTPGEYPPEYKNNASCRVGDGRVHSGEYPAAYRSSQTPLRRGDVAGSGVGFMASSLTRASLIAERVSALTSPIPGS
mmetsp:Transcript_27617/g.64003  ORF Transcript_27617/g.64003 Transcript_27617/m.64003 type:complete len:206 (-) Transcript_27617:314-931(-)